MDFVDDVHLESPAAWRVHRVLQELAHLVDLGVGSGIDLYQVDEAARVDLHAGRTLPARTRADSRLAVQAFGQDAREGRLAHTAGPGEQVRVVQAFLIQRVAQRLDHVLLPDQRLERARTPLAGENLVGHDGFLSILDTNIRWRALPPALTAISCGCFLPDLTRFTGLQCGEARRNRSGIIRRLSPDSASARTVFRGTRIAL